MAPGYWALPLMALSLTVQRRRTYHWFALATALAILGVDAFGMWHANWTPTPPTLADNLFAVLPWRSCCYPVG